MVDQLAQINMSIYFQVIIFILFLIFLFRMSWKMGSFIHITVSIIKYFIFILIFLYLFLNWASDVNPHLRESSILIMVLINIYMLWQVILAAFEVPYRRALKSCVEGVCTETDLDQTFTFGKRYYRAKYFWASLTSGVLPWHFLPGIAAERTRDDLHRLFASLDPASSIFGTNLYVHFLRHQLRLEPFTPDEAAVRQQTIDALTQDKWLSEKTNAFLHQLLTSPEDLLETGLKASLKGEGKLA